MSGAVETSVLQAAICEEYNIIEENIPDILSLKSTKVIMSPEIWPLLFEKDELKDRSMIYEDLGLDGKYILGLRRRLLQEWPCVFGNGKNLMLLEKFVALFSTMAMQYISVITSAPPRTKEAKIAMAKTLVTSCRFLVQGATDCAMQVQTAEIASVKGEKAATAFADSLKTLDAERFSIKAGNALSRVHKLTSTGNADTGEEGDGIAVESGLGGVSVSAVRRDLSGMQNFRSTTKCASDNWKRSNKR